MLSTASDLITLRGGMTVSIEALKLLWAFEDRGCIVRQGDDGSLEIGPRRLLSDADREQIRAHKPELLALVNYIDTEQ